MPRVLKIGSLWLVFCLLTACYSSIYHKGKITLKVVDESGRPVSSAIAGIGFEQYVNGQYKGIPVSGKTNAEGKFSGVGHGTNVVSIGVEKEGYYKSYGEYRFKEKKRWHWEPWNPEVTLVLRKVENPVPMFARKAEIYIPVLDKAIGFDLIEYDWVSPYGKGKSADLIFIVSRNYVTKFEFEGKLKIYTSNNNGIKLINEDLRFGSVFKLARLAPIEGYKREIIKHIIAFPGKSIKSDSMDNNNYIIRVRSETSNEKHIRAMHGKILGDFKFWVGPESKARISFKYYLNPDYTRNLEFDPKRNLFTNLENLERIGL